MTQIIIFSLGIVGAVIAATLLFVFVSRIGNRRRKKTILNLFNHLVVQHELKIGHKDFFASRLVAIDEKKKLLVYIEYQSKLRSQLVRLSDVVRCEMIRSGIGVIETRKNGKVTSEPRNQNFSLVLLLRNRAVIDLPFFNELQDGLSQFTQVSALAFDWERRINYLTSRGKPVVLSDRIGLH